MPGKVHLHFAKIKQRRAEIFFHFISFLPFIFYSTDQRAAVFTRYIKFFHCSAKLRVELQSDRPGLTGVVYQFETNSYLIAKQLCDLCTSACQRPTQTCLPAGRDEGNAGKDNFVVIFSK